MSSFVVRQFKDIFLTPIGTYTDKHGQQVTGRLPREKLPNPLTLCRMLTAMNWLYFVVGLAAWTMDGYDFHCVSLSVSNLSKEFKVGREKISESITLTLLFRTAGAAIFGIAGDMYGRKWPMIINLVIIAVLQVGTAYTFSFNTFLAVRALFGIGMGGIWGLSASMALENMPIACRGLFSGVLQQGYALGYLIAAVFNLYVTPVSKYSFRSLFYIGAGLTGAVAIARLFFPESRQFIEAKARGNAGKPGKAKAFIKESRAALRTEWKRVIYCCLLMTGFNFMSHTSQDLYPTYMQQSKSFSAAQSSRATIIAKSGAVLGGCVVGFYSQKFGRRSSIIFSALAGIALIPLWVLPDSWGALVAGAFLLQFFVQGAFGVIPIHLSELSPPQFRATFPGITYQIGNMISSPAAQIMSTISENWQVTGPKGKLIPNYTQTQAIMMTIIFLWIAIITFVGPEERGRAFEQAAAVGDTRDKLDEMNELEKNDSGSFDHKVPAHVSQIETVDFETGRKH